MNATKLGARRAVLGGTSAAIGRESAGGSSIERILSGESDTGDYSGSGAAGRPQFNADTGDRAKYSEPVIKGTPNKATEEIIDATRWKRLFGLLGWREMTETRTQQGLDRIRRSYQKKEYLMARVNLDQMEYNRAENRVTPVLTIDSGPKVSFEPRARRFPGASFANLCRFTRSKRSIRTCLSKASANYRISAVARLFRSASRLRYEQDAPAGGNIEYSLFPGRSSQTCGRGDRRQ